MGRLVCITLAALLVLSCNCTGANQAVGDIPITIVGSPAGNDAFEKRLLGYIEKRTVRVKRDCEPVEGKPVLGPKGWDPHRDLDGMGTGVILRSTENLSYIVTADHVVTPGVTDTSLIKCTISIITRPELFGTEHEFDAEIVANSKPRDLAVLQVVKDLAVSTKLEEDPFRGQHIWSVGYTSLILGRGPTDLSVSDGRLATKDVRVGFSKNRGYWHRITAQIYFGNSGGGVWTNEGELVGISVVLAGYHPDGDWPSVPYEGNYYIKPVKEIRDVLEGNDKLNGVLGQ